MGKGRFSALLELREERHQQQSQQEVSEPPATTDPEKETTIVPVTPTSTPTPPAPDDRKKKLGRPPGRRSDPSYTQVSAYVPLELLLSVQDTLAQQRRERRERTARPVSDLIEELLGTWLKKQSRK